MFMAGDVAPLQLATIELDEHESEIRGVAFSPDGLFATSSDDCTVRLWNPIESRAIRCLRGHTAYPSAIAFTSDGRSLASSSANEVILTAISNGEEIARLPIPASFGQALNLLKFSSDGSKLAGAVRVDCESQGWLILWDVGTRRELVRRRFGEHIQAISFCSADDFVAETYEASNNARVYRLRDISRDECTIYLDIKNARGGGVPYRSPTGRLMALGRSCYGSSVEMFDLSTGMALYNLEPPPLSQPSLSFSPDGSKFAWGNQSPLASTDDCRVSVYDSDTGTRISELPVVGSPHRCSFSPDGRLVCAVSMSGSGAWFWGFPSGQLVARAPNHQYFGLFSPDSRWFVSAHSGIRLSELPRVG